MGPEDVKRREIFLVP